jgi:hypothetical protein
LVPVLLPVPLGGSGISLNTAGAPNSVLTVNSDLYLSDSSPIQMVTLAINSLPAKACPLQCLIQHRDIIALK